MAQTTITDYENLFENKNIPYIIIDQQHKIKKISPSFSEMLGEIKLNPVSGSFLSDLFSVECPFIEDTLQQQYFDENKEFQNIKLCLNKDKARVFYVQVYGFITQNFSSYLLVFEEIGIKSLEFGLDFNSLNRLRVIVENIPFGLFVKDVRRDFSYVIWNKKSVAIYGFEANTVIGQTDFDIFDEITAMRYREVDENIVQTKKMMKIDSKTIINGSRQMIVNFVKTPLIGENGEVWGILGVIEDETEYLRIQSYLQLSEKRYQVLVDSISDFVWEIDQEMKFTYVSPRMKDFLGYDQTEILGKELFFLMDKEAWFEQKDIIKKLFAEKKEINEFENRLISKEGKRVYIETSAVPIYDENGEFRGYLGADRNISRRKEAEKSFQEAFEKEKHLNDMRQHFVTMTSHEFRTPISAILSSAELLEHYSENWDSEKRLEHYKKIQLFSHRLTDMLSEILTYGRLNVNKTTFPLQKLDIVKFSENVIAEIKAADNYQHAIYLVMKGEDHTLYCDGNQFKTILTNLLSNAIKYSKPNTEIVVSLDNTQSDYRLQVIDKGFGIEVDDLKNIFEPFSRGVNVSGIPGTGLGLTIVQKTVDLLNGKIDVISKPGIGSTFSVYLPKLRIVNREGE